MGLSGELIREMRALSSQTVLYSQAVAERLGINLTDLMCLGILGGTGPITAGRLAGLTGLTTGAITGVVDRLERAGYVRRERDPDDRRRVIVTRVPERQQETGAPFGSMLQASAELFSRYGDEDLALILDYVTRSNAMLQEETARLRGKTSRP